MLRSYARHGNHDVNHIYVTTDRRSSSRESVKGVKGHSSDVFGFGIVCLLC